MNAVGHTTAAARSPLFRTDYSSIEDNEMPEIKQDRRRFVRAAVMTAAASQLGRLGLAKSLLFAEGDIPSLGGAREWINSKPLTGTWAPRKSRAH